MFKIFPDDKRHGGLMLLVTRSIIPEIKWDKCNFMTLKCIRYNVYESCFMTDMSSKRTQSFRFYVDSSRRCRCYITASACTYTYYGFWIFMHCKLCNCVEHIFYKLGLQEKRDLRNRRGWRFEWVWGIIKNSTEHFTTSRPQNPSIDVSEQNELREF